MAYRRVNKTGNRDFPARLPEGDIRAISVTGTRSNYGEQKLYANEYMGQGTLGVQPATRQLRPGKANTNRTGEDRIG